MALSGLLLVGFLLGHLAGNLLVFKGREAVNDYAEFLKNSTELLWAARSGLLLVFLVHVGIGIRLQLASRAARPVPYQKKGYLVASSASRSMLLTGLVILLYLLLHLAHFTMGIVSPEEFSLTEEVMREGVPILRPDVYGMMLAGFQHDWMVALYVLGMLLLGLHLSHGISSLFQSLGLRHLRFTGIVEFCAKLLAWLLALGFITVPLSIRTGLLVQS
jgi:succinate dehydrogenase / fumarate reductase cytochrome b subunit